MNGFQRVRRLLVEGDGIVACKLLLSVYLDFEGASPVQTFAGDAVAVGNYRHRFDLMYQKCQMYQHLLSKKFHYNNKCCYRL